MSFLLQYPNVLLTLRFHLFASYTLGGCSRIFRLVSEKPGAEMDKLSLIMSGPKYSPDEMDNLFFQQFIN
jgi:hypothetical protein